MNKLKKKEDMAKKELVDFLKKCKARKISLDEASKKLVEAGWSKEEVDEAIKAIQEPIAPPPFKGKLLPPSPPTARSVKKSLWKGYFKVLVKPTEALEEEKSFGWGKVFLNLAIPLALVLIALWTHRELMMALLPLLLQTLLPFLPLPSLENFWILFSLLAGFFLFGFFLTQLILFGFSKAFKGKASLREQLSLSSLFFSIFTLLVVLDIFILPRLPFLGLGIFHLVGKIGEILAVLEIGMIVLIVFVAIMIPYLVLAYSLVLQIEALRVAHNYSLGKAFFAFFFTFMTIIAIITIVAAIAITYRIGPIAQPDISDIRPVIPPARPPRPPDAIGYFDCGTDESCFARHVLNCSLARVNLSTEIENFRISYAQRIEGWENNKCKVRFTVLKLEPSIPGINIVGKWALCRIPSYDLTNYKDYMIVEEKMRECEGPLIELYKMFAPR